MLVAINSSITNPSKSNSLFGPQLFSLENITVKATPVDNNPSIICLFIILNCSDFHYM